MAKVLRGEENRYYGKFEQYGKPLMLGLTPDVDASLKTYREKLKAAGVEKLLAYVQTEAGKYFDEKGIK